MRPRRAVPEEHGVTLAAWLQAEHDQAVRAMLRLFDEPCGENCATYGCPSDCAAGTVRGG